MHRESKISVGSIVFQFHFLVTSCENQQYKKKLIENREKNFKQSCSKQKIANVSSVNECHKIDNSFRVRKTEHMRSRQNVPGRSQMASKP